MITIAYIHDYIVQMKSEYTERSYHLKILDTYELQSKQLEEYKKRLDIMDQEKNLESRIEMVLAQFPELTDRQQQVAKLIAMGLTYSLISEQLFISQDTVRKHAMDVCLKMDQKGYKKLRHFILSEVKKTNG